MKQSDKQKQLSPKPTFEDYFYARKLKTTIDRENEYDIPSSDYVDQACVLICPEKRSDITPQLIIPASLCTVIIRSPDTKTFLGEYYKNYKKGRKIEGDNEINEDRFELQVKSNVVDINKQPLLNELFQIYQECSVNNWDGYDAQPISNEAYLEAEKLIRLLPPNIKKPEFIPEPTGEIAFEWYQGKRFIFVISVGGNNLITYAGLFGNTSKIHGTEYFGAKLPNIIIDNIKRLFERAR